MSHQIHFSLIEGIPPTKQLKQLIELYIAIFEDAQKDFFIERINTKKKLLSIIAYENNVPVGFKIGYEYDKKTFYSWIGGVKAGFRRRGIATMLAKQQEEKVKENGCVKLRTKSMNKFKPMLILNIKNGFNIVQVYTNSKEQTKIVFEKAI